jgi:alpha/beta superfamily hydrolase
MPMRPTAIGFASKKLTLEGVLTIPQGVSGPFPGLLVCHPHPVLGGNMDHPVVTAICRVADEQGIATLRFNFRGVGDSEGLFSNGSGEKEDAKAALNVLKRWPGLDSKRLAVVGYSFGASVLLDGLTQYKSARSLVLIAPPISAVEKSRIHKDKRPKLFLVGQNDRISPSVELQRVLDEVRAPVQFAEIPNADHSMRSHEQMLAERVGTFVTDTMG